MGVWREGGVRQRVERCIFTVMQVLIDRSIDD